MLYLDVGDDEEEEEEDVEEEEEELDDPAPKPADPIDFAALQRAGLSTTTKLTETQTYRKLSEEEEMKKTAEREAAIKAEEEVVRLKAIEEAQAAALDPAKIDDRLGYEKRFAKTGENFRAKEKRKREMGQQSRDSSTVEEEKRRLRHAGVNYDA